MPPKQDIQLLIQLKKGDLSAFDELYLKYYPPLCTSAFFFLKNGQEAKDLVQNLFLDLWDKKLYLHFHDDIKGYLFLAIKNRCLNHIKEQKTRHRNKIRYASLQEDPEISHAESLPDYQQHLEDALGDMPCQKRAAIQMVYMNGKKYQDAADSMRISINSLKTHLRTGLKILRGEINSRIN